MNLHPFQQRARAAAKEAFRSGKRAILYVAPTGAGKTVILGDTIASHLRHHPSPRVGVFAHRRELIQQAARTFRAFGLDVGCFGEGQSAPVQVLSTQGVTSRGEIDAFTLGCLDEAHHYASDEWGGIFAALKSSGAVICGATATPERADGRALDMFDSMIVVAQPRELVELWRQQPTMGLVPIEVIKPARRVPKGKIAQTPAEAYRRYANGMRALVFASTVAAAEEFARGWRIEDACVVHGNLRAELRDARFKAFEAGETKVLVNVAIATEGYDCPAADCAILARDVGSTALYIQMAGRIARPAPNKTRALLIDLRGSSIEIGHPQQDWTYSLEGLGVVGTESSAACRERLCKICKAPLDADAVCTRCGRDHTPGTPGAANIELERWAEKRRDTDEQRVRQLQRWFVRFPGRKPYFFIARYKAVYGAQPTSEIWARARSRGAA